MRKLTSMEISIGLFLLYAGVKVSWTSPLYIYLTIMVIGIAMIAEGAKRIYKKIF